MPLSPEQPPARRSLWSYSHLFIFGLGCFLSGAFWGRFFVSFRSFGGVREGLLLALILAFPFWIARRLQRSSADLDFDYDDRLASSHDASAK